MSTKTDRAKIEALAEKYTKKEKYEDAILEYLKLISGDEQDIPIRNIIGDLYIKMRQVDRAVEEFKKVSDYFEKKGVYTKSIAIYKRITRIAPEDIKSLRKLADLYFQRGFISEGKTEYLKLAKTLTKRNKVQEAIETYEKLLKLDSEDVESRLSLAELCIRQGLKERAVEELNEAAEFKMRQNSLKVAAEILKRSRAIKEDHSRTLENLIDLFKRENRRKDALKLVNEVLKKDKENLKALYLLGNLCYEDGELKKAREIYSKIFASHPKEVEACIKLGRIHIQNKKLDKAFECYESLIDTLVKKQREDKAIGLLGLILRSNKDHIPSLEKLASIYREKKQKRNFEIVARRIIKEYQKKNLAEKSKRFLGELYELFPEKEEYQAQIEDESTLTEIQPEAVALEDKQASLEEAVSQEEKSMKFPEPAPTERVESAEAEIPDEEAKEIVEKELGRADVYIEQGLITKAKKVLEDLRIEFPEENRIQLRLKELEIISSQDHEVDFGESVEKEAEKVKKPSEDGEKLTAAEIFADTDIVPIVTQEQEIGEKKYFDLSAQIDQEMEAIKQIIFQQRRGDTSVVEKELSSIVTEFKKQVDEKVGTADLESRFNLGIAYLEQDLLDEAIKEFMLASQDRTWEMECYTNLGECYKRKNDFNEAIEWYEKAINLVDDDSIQAFALKYEIASLYEAQGESDKALKLFSEVKDWNPEYGDVTARIENLQTRNTG
jgi:tetratricopeptide (TPR) repeat protein